MQITTDTLAMAHEAAVDAILESYRKQAIETSPGKEEQTIEYQGDADNFDDFLTLRIHFPLSEPQLSEGTPFGPGFTAAYKKQFLTLTPPRPDGKEAQYTYFNRHEDHPIFPGGSLKMGDGNGAGLKQLTNIAHKLAGDPRNRRAVSVTWNPIIDMKSIDPPCMLFVQFIIRGHFLHMRTLFRSQDILLGLPQNLVGCAALMEWMVGKINTLAGHEICEPGTLTLISTTPHIYHLRDAPDLKRMEDVIKMKKAGRSWAVQYR